MTCVLHAPNRRSPSGVSVNGVAIARAIDRARGPASPGVAAGRGLEGGGARAGRARAAAAGGAAGSACRAEPMRGCGRPPRDRRGGADPRVDGREVTHPGARCRAPAGATTSRTAARFRSAGHLRGGAYPVRRAPSPIAVAYAQARAAADAALAVLARAARALRRARAGAFRLSVGGAGRQSRPDHRRTDHA